MTITVTGATIASGAKLRWLTITPWIGSRFQTHVSIEGGDGLGVTYDHGSDNRVATLTGIVLWNQYGQEALDALGGATVTVAGGGDGVSHQAVADSPTIIDASPGVIKFSLALTEV